jgi:hypothetical protein
MHWIAVGDLSISPPVAVAGAWMFVELHKELATTVGTQFLLVETGAGVTCSMYPGPFDQPPYPHVQDHDALVRGAMALVHV